MGLYKAEGFVLRARPLGEADKLITLFTRNQGKLSVVARGARRPRSRLLGCTQLFCHGRYCLVSRRNLDLITQGEVLAFPIRLQADLHKLAYASYLAELLDAFVPEADPLPAVFDLVQALLPLLDASADQELVIRVAELRLLTLLGYKPRLDACCHCNKALQLMPRQYFSPQQGGCICPQCLPKDPGAKLLSPPALAYLRQFLQVDLARLEVLRWEPYRQEIRQVLRSYIDYYLGKKLKSLAFLAAVGEEN